VTGTRAKIRRDKTRKALLDASLALFAQRGIYAPSIEEITEAADLGKGTFYGHFSSRESLIGALVRMCLADLLAAAESALGDTPAEKIPEVLLNEHGRYFHDHPERLLLLHQARGWMKLPSAETQGVRKEFSAYLDGMRGLMAPFLKLRRIAPSQRKRAVLVFAGFVYGVLSFEYVLGGGLGSLPGLPRDGALLRRLLA
jgi:AcrR family transcriptional regulator